MRLEEEHFAKLECTWYVRTKTKRPNHQHIKLSASSCLLFVLCQSMHEPHHIHMEMIERCSEWLRASHLSFFGSSVLLIWSLFWKHHVWIVAACSCSAWHVKTCESSFWCLVIRAVALSPFPHIAWMMGAYRICLGPSLLPDRSWSLVVKGLHAYQILSREQPVSQSQQKSDQTCWCSVSKGLQAFWDFKICKGAPRKWVKTGRFGNIWCFPC